MEREELLQWRRKRLAKLVEEIGTSKELGLAIGHKAGDQVRAMMIGQRAITEKTMDLIEALPGRAGWFGRHGAKPAAPPSDLLECLRFQREFLELLPADKRQLARIALKHFVDNPNELLDVAQALERLAAD
jgi:hypothetical protein